MKYRTMGTDPKTRREVSVLSLGTMHFGTAGKAKTCWAVGGVAAVSATRS
jgi:hypothetical protein